MLIVFARNKCQIPIAKFPNSSLNDVIEDGLVIRKYYQNFILHSLHLIKRLNINNLKQCS